MLYRGCKYARRSDNTFVEAAAAALNLWFFHPDYTVGTGIAPVQPIGYGMRAGLADFHRRWRISLRPETDKMYSAITHRNYIIYPPDGFVNRARVFLCGIAMKH